jgi:hypothetical protein
MSCTKTQHPLTRTAGAMLMVLGALGPAAAQDVLLVSRSASVGQGAGGQAGGLSDDGRFFVFGSAAPNLIPGQVDTNNAEDMFLQDRVTGILTLVSHVPGSSTATPDDQTYEAQISGDGNWVVFVSPSTNLVGGTDTNGGDDVFLFERATGTVRLVSHIAGAPTTSGNGVSQNAVISADGNYVAFQSRATNLLPLTDTNGDNDVFLYERSSGSLALVSHTFSSPTTAGNGDSYWSSISGGGDVAFISGASNLVAGTSFNAENVFHYARSTGIVTLVSHAAGTPTAGGNGNCGFPVFSRDGSSAAFESEATNLVPGQSGGPSGNTFLWDKASNTSQLASHVPGSSVTGGNDISVPSGLSGDGRYVAFESGATNLSGGPDTNGFDSDAFLFDRNTDTVTLLSHAEGATTTTANDMSFMRAISLDGSYVAFSSWATNLLPISDVNGSLEDAFLYETATGTTSLVSHAVGQPTTTGNARSIPASLGSDGSYIGFSSLASDLVAQGAPDALEDAFLQARASGATTIVSHPFEGSVTADGASTGPRRGSMSDDGRFVVFASAAGNLVPSQADGNGVLDVFLYDRAAGAVTLVSHASGSGTTAANGLSKDPAISADGSRVAFSSSATDLVPGAGGFGVYNIFLYELQTGAISLVSHSTASPTLGGNDASDFPTLNGDGSRVAFQSQASNLVTGSDTGNTEDVFVFERATGAIALVSHTPSSPTTSAGPDSVMPVLSRTGDDLVFVSSSPSLVVGTDSNHDFDVFLWDSRSGLVSLVSHVPGSMGTAGNFASGVPPGLFPQGPVQQEISGDGSLVAFVSQANNLAGGPDGNIGWDVFVYQKATGNVALASHAVGAPTTAGNDYSSWPSLAIDGSTVAFDSRATDLVAGMSGSGANVYFYDLASGAVALASHAVGSPTTGGNGASIKPTTDAAGAHIAFASSATNLLTSQDTNGTYDVFDYDRGTDSVLLASHIPSSTTSAGNGASGAEPPLEDAYLAISGDGLRVAFESDASDLVAGDLNLSRDVFLYSSVPLPVELQDFTVE